MKVRVQTTVQVKMTNNESYDLCAFIESATGESKHLPTDKQRDTAVRFKQAITQSVG